MALLPGKEILRPFIRKASGYLKSLLSAEHVEMNNGTTLQQTLDGISKNLTYYILEQGSNSYGSYRKYSDGKVEIWGQLTITLNGAATITKYPCDIIEPPIVWATIQYSSNYPTFSLSVQPLDGRTNIYVRDATGKIPTSNVTAFWYGISRWR